MYAIGGTNFILRIKEQETCLTLLVHGGGGGGDNVCNSVVVVIITIIIITLIIINQCNNDYLPESRLNAHSEVTHKSRTVGENEGCMGD
jgi:hypothetical protein